MDPATRKIAPSGSYLIILCVSQPIRIKIGALGVKEFDQGTYIYVGSAMNGKLFSRIKRHLLPSIKKKIHWHIDYLLASGFARIEKIIMIPSSQKEECALAETILNKTKQFIPKFGCSDCKCPSHLFLLEENNHQDSFVG